MLPKTAWVLVEMSKRLENILKFQPLTKHSCIVLPIDVLRIVFHNFSWTLGYLRRRTDQRGDGQVQANGGGRRTRVANLGGGKQIAFGKVSEGIRKKVFV